MDLRIVKTKNNIHTAFLELRSQYPIEKIRVNRLCEIALINKTTFYKHYQDLYTLSEEIENNTIQSIMNSFEQMKDLFSDPEGFMKGLYLAFKPHEDIIMTLFSGRMNILINKVEEQLITYYPWISSTPEKAVLLSFLLWGVAHVLIESRYEETVLLDTLIRAAKQIVFFIDDQSFQQFEKV